MTYRRIFNGRDFFDDFTTAVDSFIDHLSTDEIKRDDPQTEQKSVFNVCGKSPKINAYRDDEKLTLEVFIVGYSKNEISVEVEGDCLVIANKSSEKKDSDKRECVMREFNFPKINRKVRLSEDMDIDNIKAKSKYGLLTIDIPWKKSEGRNIKINIG